MGGPTTHYGGTQGISLEGELFEERCELEEMDGEPYEQQCEYWELSGEAPNTEAHTPTVSQTWCTSALDLRVHRSLGLVMVSKPVVRALGSGLGPSPRVFLL